MCAVASTAMLRACLKIGKGAAARDFGCGQGGEVRTSPKRAVRTEPTPATAKRPAARRVFAPRAGRLRCSSVEDPQGIFSFVAPRHPARGAKTAPFRIFSQALRAVADQKRNSVNKKTADKCQRPSMSQEFPKSDLKISVSPVRRESPQVNRLDDP